MEEFNLRGMEGEPMLESQFKELMDKLDRILNALYEIGSEGVGTNPTE